MMLYRLALPLVALVLFSCGNRPSVTTAPTPREPTKVDAKESPGQPDEFGRPTKYIQNARLELKNEVITVTSRYAVVDGKVDEAGRYGAPTNYFVCLNKATGRADTIEAGLDNLGGGTALIIRDMTDSFHLKPFIVEVVTPAEDIYYTSSFVGYRNGKFQTLFSLADTREEGVELHRDGLKLKGCVSGRDEVVENLERYPVEIDVNTFEVSNIQPRKQYIGWETTATEPFRAHRVIDGKVDTSLVAVEAGAKVTVDTLYRAIGKVRLRLEDSVIVEIRTETATKKLEHNGAG
jgi:hypothetical protein